MSMTFQSKPQEPAETGHGIFDPKDLNRLLDALRTPVFIQFHVFFNVFDGFSMVFKPCEALDPAKMRLSEVENRGMDFVTRRVKILVMGAKNLKSLDQHFINSNPYCQVEVEGSYSKQMA